MTRSTNVTASALKLCFLLLLAVLASWAPRALAAATNCTSAGGTISLPPVTVPANPAVGSLVGTPASVTVTFTCSGLPYSQPQAPNNYSLTATIQAGLLAPADPTDNPNADNGIIFATNLPGLALQLTASPVQANDRAWVRGGPGGTRGFEPGAVTAPASAWQCTGKGRNQTCTGTYTGSVSETFTAQLIVTGPVTTGTLSAINLMQFNWYIYGISPSQGYFASLILNSTVVRPPACTVVNNNLTVTLPTVYTSTFSTTGSVTGQTPFNLQLNCSAGTNVSITLTPGTPAYTNAQGVLTNTSGPGYAGNMGVQLFQDSSCTSAIVFNSAIPEGTTPNGSMSLPFCASYYQTGTPVTAGRVTATATYTLTYQ